MQLDSDSAILMQVMQNQHVCAVSSFKSINNIFTHVNYFGLLSITVTELLVLKCALQKVTALGLHWRSIQPNGPLDLGKPSHQAKRRFLVNVTALSCWATLHGVVSNILHSYETDLQCGL